MNNLSPPERMWQEQIREDQNNDEDNTRRGMGLCTYTKSKSADLASYFRRIVRFIWYYQAFLVNCQALVPNFENPNPGDWGYHQAHCVSHHFQHSRLFLFSSPKSQNPKLPFWWLRVSSSVSKNQDYLHLLQKWTYIYF